jgi:hypothetical protein
MCPTHVCMLGQCSCQALLLTLDGDWAEEVSLAAVFAAVHSGSAIWGHVHHITPHCLCTCAWA